MEWASPALKYYVANVYSALIDLRKKIMHLSVNDSLLYFTFRLQNSRVFFLIKSVRSRVRAA